MKIAFILLLFCGYIHAQLIDPRDVRGTALVSSPSGPQAVIQPINTNLTVVSSGTGTLAATSTNGQLNEELFSGGTVAARVNSAITACGTSYAASCIIVIPTYAPVGIGWNVPTNNIIINDQRVNNGQGVFGNGQTDPLPQLHALYNYNFTANDNDPSETIAPNATVLGCSITSNVATCTTTNPNSLIASEAILIANMTGTPALNSNLNTGATWTVLSSGLSSTQFEFNVTAANQSFVADSGIVGTACNFCGKNDIGINSNIVGGSTTNGSNASVTALSIQNRRESTSTRQSIPLVLGNYCFPSTNASQFCEGAEIDMGNSSVTDDNNLSITGLRLVNTGFRSGIGIQLTDVGGTSAAGWLYGMSLNNYHIYGIQFQSGDTSRIADAAFVPPADDTNYELQGLNHADNATVWSINDVGTITGARLAATVGVTNSTGMQKVIGATGCTTAASVGATCSVTINWSPAFIDANYSVTCSISGGSIAGVPVVSNITSKTGSSISVTEAALTTATAGGPIDCIAMHN